MLVLDIRMFVQATSVGAGSGFQAGSHGWLSYPYITLGQPVLPTSGLSLEGAGHLDGEGGGWEGDCCDCWQLNITLSELLQLSFPWRDTQYSAAGQEESLRSSQGCYCDGAAG